MFKSKQMGPFLFYRMRSVLFGGHGSTRWAVAFFGIEISYSRPIPVD